MGHRALIAYEREDSLYNVHYSHWGALHLRLKRDITAETPFGEDAATREARSLFEALRETYDEEAVSRLISESDLPHAQIDHDPLVIAIAMEDILTEYLDFLHHEAFYVIDTDFEVTAYRTHWFGLQYDCRRDEHAPTIGNGALRTVRWYDGEPVGDGYVQGEFRALKRTMGVLIDRGVFSPAEATEFMRELLSQWADDRTELVIRTPEEA